MDSLGGLQCESFSRVMERRFEGSSKSGKPKPGRTREKDLVSGRVVGEFLSLLGLSEFLENSQGMDRGQFLA